MEDMGIFKAYDIRGLYPQELNEEIAGDIGKAIGSMAGKKTIYVGNDTRVGTYKIKDSFISGLLSTGARVIDVGMVPIAVPALASFDKKTYGVCITASHNPPQYTGILPFYMGKSVRPRKVKEIYESKSFLAGKGTLKKGDYQTKYLLRITKGMKDLKFKVGVDAMGGSGTFASKLALNIVGAEPKLLRPSISMDFFGMTPEPSKENMKELSKFVLENHLDLGVQLDGDADRLDFMDESGNFIDPVVSALMFIKYMKIKEAVINVSCPSIFKRFTNVKFVPVGRPNIEGAKFGFETSSHYYFGDYFPASDALLPMVLMLKVMKTSGKKMSELVKEMPKVYYEIVPIRMKDSDEINRAMISAEKEMERYGKVDRMDGAKVYFDNGSILVRKSETEPLIRVFYEGVDEESFLKMKELAYKIMPWK